MNNEIRLCACKCGQRIPDAAIRKYPSITYIDRTHRRRAQQRRYRKRIAEIVAQARSPQQNNSHW